MYNLRSGLFIPGPAFTASYEWLTDVPVSTGILGISNPSSNTKKAYVYSMSVGARNNTLTKLVNINIFTTAGVTPGTLIPITKFNSDSAETSVLAIAGGSWTLAGMVRSIPFTLNSGIQYQPIGLDIPITLNPGEGIVCLVASESGNEMLLPSASFSWYEV